MNRREYLTTTGAGVAALLAGCTGGDPQEIDDEQATPEPEPEPTASGGSEPTEATEADTDTPTETDTPTPEAEPDLSFVSHELVVNEGQYRDEIFVAAEVENAGSGPSGGIELAVNWYNADGDLVDDSTERLATLRAGTTWKARVYALGLDADEVDDYEIEGQFTDQLPEPPVGAEIIESDHNVSPDGGVTVTGRMENTADEPIDYVEGIGQVLDADGNVLSDRWTNQTDIPAGETWRFEVEWFQFARADAVADHAVYVDSGLF